MNNKVDEYYNKILEYSYEFMHEIDVKQREDFIKKVINTLILNNEEYLLTDSFLNYLAYDHHYLANFHCIISDDIFTKYSILDSYFDHINSDYISRDNHSQVDYHLFTKELDLDTKKATLLSHAYRTKARSKYYYDVNAYGIYYYIFNSILSYCFINQRMNEYEEICKPLIDNPDNILDYFYNNGAARTIIDNDFRNLESNFKKKFYHLMINIIENSNKKTIQ